MTISTFLNIQASLQKVTLKCVLVANIIIARAKKTKKPLIIFYVLAS